MSTIEDMKKKKSQINEIIKNINDNDLSAFQNNFKELQNKFPNDKDLVYQEIYTNNEYKTIYQTAISGSNNQIFKEVNNKAIDQDKNQLINTEELFKAIESNDVKKVDTLLFRKVDPYSFNEEGYAIEKAVINNNIENFSNILEKMQSDKQSYELFSEDVLNKCSQRASEVNTLNFNDNQKNQYEFMLNILDYNGADMVLNNSREKSINLENMIAYSNEDGIKYLMNNHKDKINLNNPEYINDSMEKVFESVYFQDSPIKGPDKDILNSLMENNFSVELNPKSIEKLTNTIKSEQVKDLTKDLINHGFDIQSHDNSFANNLINTSGNVEVLKEFIVNEKIGSKNHDKLITTAIERGHHDIAKEVINNANKLENPSDYFVKATEKAIVNNEFEKVMNTVLDKSENKEQVLNDSLLKMVNKNEEAKKVITNYDFKINNEVKELYKDKNQELLNVVNKKELNSKLNNNLEERKKEKGIGFKI